MTTVEALAEAEAFVRAIGADRLSRDYSNNPAWLETDAAMLRILLASKRLLKHLVTTVDILSHPNATEDTGSAFLANHQDGTSITLSPAFRILGSDPRYANLVPSAFARLQGMKLRSYLGSAKGETLAKVFAYVMDAETENHAFTKLSKHGPSQDAFLESVLKDKGLTEQFIREASFRFVTMLAKSGSVNVGAHPLERLRWFIDRLQHPAKDQWQGSDHAAREICLQFLTRVWMHDDFSATARGARSDAVRAAVVRECPGVLFYFYPLWGETYGATEQAAIKDWLSLHHPDRAELPADWAYKLTHPHVNVNWSAFNNYTVNHVMLRRPL